MSSLSDSLTPTLEDRLRLQFISARGHRPRLTADAYLKKPFPYDCDVIPRDQVADLLGGGRTVQTFGERLFDLKFSNLYMEFSEWLKLDEMINRKHPVRLYTLAPVGHALYSSLDNSLEGDPADGTMESNGWAAGVDDSAKAYVLTGDEVEGGYAEEFDPDDPLFVYGLLMEPASVCKPAAGGRGIYTYRGYTNKVQNALFGEVTADVPADWTADNLGAAGTGHGVDEGGCAWNPGIDALYCAGTFAGDSTWTSDKFDVPSGLDTFMASVLCQTWGTCPAYLKVQWYDSGGSPYGTAQTLDSCNGTAWLRGDAVRPDPSAVKAALVLQHGCGLTRWSLPQFIVAASGAAATPPDRRYVAPLFIGTAAKATTATIKPSEPIWQTLIGPSNTLQVMSGYTCIPMSIAECANLDYAFASMSGSHLGTQITLGWYVSAGDVHLGLWVDGALQDNDTVLGHSAGDCYFWSVVRDASSGLVEGFLRRVDGTTTWSVSDAAGLVYGDSFRIGSQESFFGDGIMQAEAIHQHLMVGVAHDWGDVSDWMELMAKRTLIDVVYRTTGREYHAYESMKRDPFNPGLMVGNVSLEQLRRI